MIEIAMSYFRMGRRGACLCPLAANARMGYGFTLRCSHIYQSSEILPGHFFSLFTGALWFFPVSQMPVALPAQGGGRRRQAVESTLRAYKHTPLIPSGCPCLTSSYPPHYCLSLELPLLWAGPADRFWAAASCL